MTARVLPEPREWMADAACLDGDLDVWFPGGDDPNRYDRARAICKGCPARDECLAAAMAEEGASGPSSRHGMRGGLTAGQRYTRYLTTRTPGDASTDGRKRPVQRPNCGTEAGQQAHRRYDEAICDPCGKARAEAMRRRRAERKARAAS